MEGQTQQAALVVMEDAVGDVEEGLRLDGTVGSQAQDPATLLHDEAMATAISGSDQEHRRLEAVGHRLQLQRQLESGDPAHPHHRRPGPPAAGRRCR